MIKKEILNKKLSATALFLLIAGVFSVSFAYGLEEEESRTSICISSAKEIKNIADGFYNTAKKELETLKKNEEIVAQLNKTISNARRTFGSPSTVVNNLEKDAALHTAKTQEIKENIKKNYREAKIKYLEAAQLGSTEAREMYEVIINNSMIDAVVGKKNLIGLLIDPR